MSTLAQEPSIPQVLLRQQGVFDQITSASETRVNNDDDGAGTTSDLSALATRILSTASTYRAFCSDQRLNQSVSAVRARAPNASIVKAQHKNQSLKEERKAKKQGTTIQFYATLWELPSVGVSGVPGKMVQVK